MHAEQDPADPDGRDEHADAVAQRGARPAGPGVGQEGQQHGAVTDDRAERVPAGEAVPGAVRDRVRDHRASRPTSDLRIGSSTSARPGDQQIEGQLPAPPDRHHGRGHAEHGPQHAVAAQPGDRLDHRDQRRVPGDEAVQPGRGVVVSRLQWAPAQPHRDQQHGEHQRGHGHHDQVRCRAAGLVGGGHGRTQCPPRDGSCGSGWRVSRGRTAGPAPPRRRAPARSAP